MIKVEISIQRLPYIFVGNLHADSAINLSREACPTPAPPPGYGHASQLVRKSCDLIAFHSEKHDHTCVCGDGYQTVFMLMIVRVYFVEGTRIYTR